MSGVDESATDVASAQPKRPTANELRAMYTPNGLLEQEVARPLYILLKRAAKGSTRVNIPCDSDIFKGHTMCMQGTRPNGMPYSVCILDEDVMTFLKKHFCDMSVTLDKAGGSIVFDWWTPPNLEGEPAPRPE